MRAKRQQMKTNEQRKLYYKAVNRKRDKDINQHRKIIAAALNGSLEPFLKRLEQAGDYKESYLNLITDNGLRFAIRHIYTSTGYRFAQTSERSFKSVSKKELGLTTFEMDVDALLNDFSENGLGYFIVNMNLYTRKLIATDVVNLMNEGLSIPEIALQLAVKYKSVNKVRGLTIARTETIKASNWGALQGAEASGVEYVKEWNSIADNRRRTSHKIADGKQAKRGVPFNVNGSKMLYPCDTSLGAAAEEVINCRCVIDFVPPKDYDPALDSSLLGANETIGISPANLISNNPLDF